MAAGLLIDLVSVDALTVSAETPGEVSGEAVAVTISFDNESRAEIDLSSAVVTLVAGGGELGIGTTAGPVDHLDGVIGPGESAKGTYVFMLEPAGRELMVSVNYAVGAPVVIFNITSN